MKTQCKTCGKNCEGEYCFQHKPRKKISSKKTLQAIKDTFLMLADMEDTRNMHTFFREIWRKKEHYSEISNTYLGNEALSIFFHHILPKEKYPQARLDEENIILLTLDEHTNVESDIYRYDEINKRRELLKKKYEI